MNGIINMYLNKIKTKLVKQKWPILCMAIFLIFSYSIISFLINIDSQNVSKGEWNVSEATFDPEKSYPLNGEWEFYWNKLLQPSTASDNTIPATDVYIQVPGSWSDKQAGETIFPAHGIATYRMHIKIPSTIEDPAIKIKRVSRAVSVCSTKYVICSNNDSSVN